MSLGIPRFSFRPGLNLILGSQVKVLSILGDVVRECKQTYEYKSYGQVRGSMGLGAGLHFSCQRAKVVIVHGLSMGEGYEPISWVLNQNPKNILIWGLPNVSWEPLQQSPLSLELRHLAKTVLLYQEDRLFVIKKVNPRKSKPEDDPPPKKTLWAHLLED